MRTLVLVTASIVLAACGSPSTTPSASAVVPTTSPSPMPWPTVQLEPLPPGRYAISPPFDLEISLDVPEGWHTLHLHGEFVDIGWFAGEVADGVPERVIAFGHPTTVRGDVDVPAAGLTADEVASLLRGRTDLQAGAPNAFRLGGLDGLWLDVVAPEFDTRLFSGPDGDGLGIGPDKVVRTVVVPLANGELLLVTVHADPGDMPATWDAALPILGSVDLPR